MKRFMGMMPSDEIEESRRFRDEDGHMISLDAGPNGWTVYYADNSTDYKDESKSTEENVEEAIAKIKEHFPEVTEVE